MAMTPNQRTVFLKFLQDSLEQKIKTLELYEKFPEQFRSLGKDLDGASILRIYTKSIIPTEDKIECLKEEISKFKKQLSLLENSAVETMNEQDFEKYINS